DVNPVTLPESLSFNYGEQSKTLLVELMPDQMLEGTEFVTFQLAAGHSLDGMTAIGAQSTTTLEIQDSRLSYVEFGKSHYRVNEEDDTTQIELTLTRSGNLNQDAFAELVFKGGTADWSDFTVDLPGPIEFLTGQTTQTVQVTINPDAMPEGLETVEFGVVGVNGAVTGIQDSATLEILDTTGYNSIVEFAQSRYVTFEHHSLAGPTDGAVTITLTRTGDLSSYTEVELLLNGGTASYQQDYEVVEYIEGLAQPSDFPKLVRFEAGESQKTFTVNVYHYPDNRHDEFVSFEIANLGGYGNGTVIGANSKTTLEILGDESMYQVTSAADSGAGSLREAIHWINTNGGGIIEFALPDGSTIIKLDSALPEITAPVVIDGYTQPGAMENMMAVGFDGILPVQIDGANTQSASGLVLGEGAEGSTIQGLQIYNFDQEGLKVLSSGNTIRGNIIVNNSGDGIQVGDGASIGSSNNVIGGANAGDRNIISGNGDDGIDIKKDSNNNVVKGNYVGLTADGMGAQGNSDMGIQVDGSSNNVIGGSMPGEGNVVSTNGVNGIFIAVDLENNFRGIATNNQVIGNYIGTDAAGNLNNLGNGEAGVAIAAASDNTVGGTMPGEGNLIMDNGTGIMVLEVDAGLFGTFSANNNSLLGNAINDSMGIGIDLGTLQLNGDIDGLGVSPNDPGDGDTGANGLQNFPVLTSATVENGMLVVEGTLEGMADQEYYLEFFANDMPDGSGYGEGQRFLGSQFIPAGMGGSMPFFFDVPLSPDFVAPGQTITATATAVNMMGNQEFDYLGTSEFSAGIVLQGSSLPNLVISEIMYNPDSSEPGWEWLEVYNAGDTPLDLTGFVLDDDDGTALSQANIAGGLLDVGKTAVLYNADVLTEADFAAAWGDGINLIGVTNWSGLNNSGGDRLALWRSYEDYGARNFEMAIDEV
ncbi:MAG: Calx-beta domain-containing protein, partial [Elainellaceae cyanobacterium]